MIKTVLLLAAAAQAAAPLALVRVPQSAPTADYASVDGLQCDARTVTGATLSFEMLQMGTGKNMMLMALGKPNGALIKSGQGLVLMTRRSGPREDEYSTGPNFVRIEREGNVRDLTLWSVRSGAAFQPVAYGFCVKAKLAAPAAPAPDTVLDGSLDRAKATEGCYMTTAQPEPWRGPFTTSSNIGADRRMMSSFTGLPDGIGAKTLNRETLGKAPPADHADIDMMVGRFFNASQRTAPHGMDVIYLDRTTRRGTILVKFDDLDGKGKQAFGICAFDVAKVEKP